MAQSAIKVSKPEGKGHQMVEDYKFELLTNDAYAALLSLYVPFHFSDDGARHQYKHKKTTLAIPSMLKMYNKKLTDIWDINELLFIPYDDIPTLEPKNPPKIPVPIRVKIKEKRSTTRNDIISASVDSLKSDPDYVLTLARNDPEFMSAIISGLDALIAEQESVKEEQTNEQPNAAPEPATSTTDVEQTLNDVALTGKKFSINDLQKILDQNRKGNAK